METKILVWNQIEEASSLLKEGEVIAFPTETVYGLGAIYSSKDAYNKLMEVKNRPESKPFTLMCSNPGYIGKFAKIDSKTINLIRDFMPGEITLLLEDKGLLPDYVTLGTGVLGVRVPRHENLLNLLDKVGEPLLVPSANKSGEKPASSFEEVFEVFNKEIPAVIKGMTISNVPSTIVKVVKGELQLIREGSIPFADIEKSFNKEPISISLGSDHGGLEYKNAIRDHLLHNGFKVLDEGTLTKDSCDYPFFAEKACLEVVNKKADFAILVCTSGEGISIAANKINGIRCGIGYDDEAVMKCREHNNCNAIAFGEKYMSKEDVLRRIDIFLTSSFSTAEKHSRRVKEISSLEK